ncbi:MAG: FAD:protein FMN transferase [Clostridium sp.]|nr:FAD:protein FMN transferase [Clostridium sp.]
MKILQLFFHFFFSGTHIRSAKEGLNVNFQTSASAYRRILIGAAAALILAVSALSGCSSAPKEPISSSQFMLDTFVTVTLYDSEDEEILKNCFRKIKHYEDIFSTTIETSEVYRLNHRTADQTEFDLSDDTAALLAEAIRYSEFSDGDYDVTVEPLSSLWNFSGGRKDLPADGEIREAVSKVDYRNIRLEGNHLTFLSPDTTIDLGSIAKGYIADRLKDDLTAQGVGSAIINLGGNVLCIGQKGNDPFKIGLQKPFADRSETFAALRIKDQSVVSSGVYERNFFVDGKNYHHILNPKSGYPYDNGLINVTIVSDRSVDGDALSTTCFSMGLERGMELINRMDGVYGYFLTDDYVVHYTDGAKDLVEQVDLPEEKK